LSNLDPTSFIYRYGEDATWLKRTLGTRDTETGEPAVTWTTEEIKVYIEVMSHTLKDTDGGEVDEIRMRLYTVSAVAYKHRLVVSGETYEVEMEPDIYRSGGSEVYRGFTVLKVS